MCLRRDLVSGLNDVFGAGTYDYIATGAIGTDAIRVAFIYKPASVSLVGDYAILDSSVDSPLYRHQESPGIGTNLHGQHNRRRVHSCKRITSNPRALPVTMSAIRTPVMVQATATLTRKAAAEALVDWLASDPTGSGDADFMIIGDLNSYDKEDPIDAILAGGYTDLIHHFLGEDAYSYVFDGQTGYLDYGLANAAMMDEITGATVWHINADEPDLIDYDTSFELPAQDAIYAQDPYRSSDHDPVIIGLDVC